MERLLPNTSVSAATAIFICDMRFVMEAWSLGISVGDLAIRKFEEEIYDGNITFDDWEGEY